MRALAVIALLAAAPAAADRFTRDAGFSGTVVMDRGAPELVPVADATLTLRPASTETAAARGVAPVTTRSDRTGHFAFARLAAIDWDLEVRAPHAATLQRAHWSFRADGRFTATSPVTLTLRAAIPYVGCVVDVDGRLLRGVRVHVAETNDDFVTDARGRFTVETSDAPQLHASARRADGSVGSALLHREPGHAPTDPTDLVLRGPRDPRVLHGRIVDERGRPVAGAAVSVSACEARTDRAGRFTCDADADEVYVHVDEHGAYPAVSMPHAGELVLTVRDP